VSGAQSPNDPELVTQDSDLDILRIGSPAATEHAEDRSRNKESEGPPHHGEPILPGLHRRGSSPRAEVAPLSL
jgi:hypothetical protein